MVSVSRMRIASIGVKSASLELGLLGEAGEVVEMGYLKKGSRVVLSKSITIGGAGTASLELH
eukprot:COSAG01_NODE_2057_length_8526_cov_21.248576_11_plen_62_part_00